MIRLVFLLIAISIPNIVLSIQTDPEWILSRIDSLIQQEDIDSIEKFTSEMGIDIHESSGKINGHRYHISSQTHLFGLKTFYLDIYPAYVTIHQLDDSLLQIEFYEFDDLKRSKVVTENGWGIYNQRHENIFTKVSDEKIPEKYLDEFTLLTKRFVSSSEYGWICEYSTVGFPPKQRSAILTLVRNNEIQLIRRILRSENPEGQIYAVDALLYLQEKGYELSKSDRELIDFLRNAAHEIITCGNMGSFKQYITPISEVLSQEKIDEIEKAYDDLLKYY